MKKFLIVTIMGLIPFLHSCNNKQNSENQTSQEVYEHGYLVKVGEKAPDFTSTLNNGETFKLSDHLGKVVMLQFTASWCGVCRREMPFIESDIWQKHKNDDFVLIGIDRDEPLRKLNKLAKETGISYPLGLDDDANIFGLYSIKNAGVTRNVIIDREGNIAMLTRGFNEAEFNEMKDFINKLLNN